MRIFPYMDGDRLIELVERRELDAALAEIARLTALIRRLHNAISAMCADEPTGDERLDLMNAWNAAACGQ